MALRLIRCYNLLTSTTHQLHHSLRARVSVRYQPSSIVTLTTANDLPPGPVVGEGRTYERLTGRVVLAEQALRQEVQHHLGQYTCDAVIERLLKSDVAYAPVRSTAEVMADEYVYQRGTLGLMRQAKSEQPVDRGIPGFPVVFFDSPLPDLPGPPRLEVHHYEILGIVLGLSDEQSRQLQENGVVGAMIPNGGTHGTT